MYKETYDRTRLGLHMAPVETPAALPSPQAFPSLMGSREQARSARGEYNLLKLINNS